MAAQQWVCLKSEAQAVARQAQMETEAPLGAAVWYRHQTVQDCSSPDVVLPWLETFLEILLGNKYNLLVSVQNSRVKCGGGLSWGMLALSITNL